MKSGQSRPGALVLLLFLSLLDPLTLLGTSPGNLAVGWLSELFAKTGHLDPITDAVLFASSVWLLAIPCFVVAAKATKTS